MLRTPAVSSLGVLLFVAALAPGAALAQGGAGVESEIPPPPPGSTTAPEPGEDTPPSSYDVPPPPTEGRYPAAATRASDGAIAETAAETEGVRIPSRIATRLRVLDADLNVLSSRGSNGLVDGILSILSGGLSITLGFVINDDSPIATWLFLYGGANVARGILNIALAPDPSEHAIQFSHMPMGTVGEVKARLRYGEESLESLADRSRLVRILDASINIASGAAIVPLYFSQKDEGDPLVSDAFDTIVLIAAGISVISGVISLLTRTEAERRWAAYEGLRDRLVRERRDQLRRRRTAPTVGAGPLPNGGGAVTVGAEF